MGEVDGAGQLSDAGLTAGPTDSPDAAAAKRIVEQGYDRVAERHAAWAAAIRQDERLRYVHELLDRLPEGARVLELGCGQGIPTTRLLAERFSVIGVDISAAQLAFAQRDVPNATFVHADMVSVTFPPQSFDGIAAFFSLIHVPRGEHAALLERIAGWLRPDGLLVAAMGARDNPGEVEDDWLGAPMFFSHWDTATNRRLVEESGLRILSAREETADEDGAPITFLWVVAEKPRD
ncbi:MAG TPA: methyltransferase domain-containing protein [Ktedonobacterales bacterium]|jgi:SAM-dependent methyltransferase|nr:methyltransferase domain-containing protein [Ktedonobacterales bacterium]